MDRLPRHLIDYCLHFIESCMTRRETNSNYFPDRFAVGLGLITAGLGLVSGFNAFVSWHNAPGIVALGFIALGLALIASGSSRSKPAIASAAVAVTLGVGTLGYYLTGWALPFSEVGWSKMAPTAGLCFLLIGAALLLQHFVPPPHRALMALLAGCSTTALRGNGARSDCLGADARPGGPPRRHHGLPNGVRFSFCRSGCCSGRMAGVNTVGTICVQATRDGGVGLHGSNISDGPSGPYAPAGANPTYYRRRHGRVERTTPTRFECSRSRREPFRRALVTNTRKRRPVAARSKVSVR